MTVQRGGAVCYCTDQLIFRISVMRQITTSDIIFERIQIQCLKFTEADVFHRRRWSGSRETAQYGAMIGNIPMRGRSPLNNIIRITSNYQVQNMSLNVRG